MHKSHVLILTPISKEEEEGWMICLVSNQKTVELARVTSTTFSRRSRVIERCCHTRRLCNLMPVCPQGVQMSTKKGAEGKEWGGIHLVCALALAVTIPFDSNNDLSARFHFLFSCYFLLICGESIARAKIPFLSYISLPLTRPIFFSSLSSTTRKHPLINTSKDWNHNNALPWRS